MTELAALTWTQVRTVTDRRTVLAVPVGATEQHGPHLPLSTDTDLAVALCERLAAARAQVLVAPAIAYGSSGEHEGFPGTLSIGQHATELLLVELARSATGTFEHILFVSAHGGNAGPVHRAVRTLRSEDRDVHVFTPHWSGDPHAGRPETAMQLALHPQTVRLERAVAGTVRPLSDLMPALRSGGVRAVSESGVLGDPTGATAAEGAALLDDLTAALIGEVDQWCPGR
ncbi:mycofactocin biosynthesis peptidyl-dipeptidase MftE [Nocardia sp. NPDC051030]|uniref:mycofactocin biosynthesis peptidyl-dipeptidase MftE n=1 Tax=Nocardia sp. NPDC051030 TaxID=3155162 RepID=UPI003442BD22